MHSTAYGIRMFIAGILILFLTACGGGGEGNASRIFPSIKSITIQAADTTLPANPNLEQPSLLLPFTTSVIVLVEQTDGAAPNGTVVNIAVDGVNHGAISKLDDPETEDENEFLILTGNNFTETSGGRAQFFFTSFSTPGVTTLTASVQDPLTGSTVRDSIQIVVTDINREVASLTFGGAFVNAVLTGQSTFGTALSGVFSRVVSVVANDASGNPVPPGTLIHFFLIDAPITGYPNLGAGSFFMAGDNGDPLEGGFFFNAVGAGLLSKSARRFDRLVLDGRQRVPVPDNPLPDNRFHTGVRVIDTILDQNSLFIDRQGAPFNQGSDNGATVPWIIGRAQHATILSPSFTDVTGTASTALTYPSFRLGQTAVLVACSDDFGVCTVLNTCDAQGANCSPVYLGASDGTNRILTTSATTLGPNTTTNVELCVFDPNFTPLPAVEITYSISSARGGTVTVNGDPADIGTLTTRGDGCFTATIASSGQIAGSEPIEINFTTDGVAEPVVITINAPGAGNLIGTIEDGTVNLRLIDDNGNPIPDTFITHTFEVNDVDNSCDTEGFERSNIIPTADVTYDPTTQVTDAEGRLTAFVSITGDAGDSVTVTFAAVGGAQFAVTFTIGGASLPCPEPAAEG